tara:strand:+ start:603 stop:911 length:309 start_codon:yes stop_codon:yes gene_type:complete
MELTKKQAEEITSATALKAAFKPRSEWTIEDYRVWLQISEDLLKQERGNARAEKLINDEAVNKIMKLEKLLELQRGRKKAYKRKLQKLEAFVEQITCNHCGK